MASGWTAREEVLTVGRTVLLGAAWILATACTYLTEDGGVVFAEGDAMALELPDNCEAHRTASGYTVSCSEGSGDAAGDSTTTSEFAATEGVALGEGAPPPVVPEVDHCDDSAYEAGTWVSVAGPHITLHAVAGTAAANEAQALLAQHESAYAAVRGALGISTEPGLQLILSPNRVAASHFGLEFGLAVPGAGRIEAIYDGSPDAYVKTHPGYLVTASLLGHVVPSGHYALPLLAVGLNEHLDQSGRDLHLDYAYSVVSALDDAETLGELDDSDVWGDNSAVAGSLVSFMAARHGMDKVMNLVDATAVTWEDEGYLHAEAGFIDTEERLDALLAQAVPEAMGEEWADLRNVWQREVLGRLNTALPEVEDEDRDAIVNLVRVADQALNGNDAAAYRAIMDGFYCEGFDDAARLDVASEMTQAMADVDTQVLRVYPGQARNFRTARVLATRTQGFDGVGATYYDVEHFKAGWRVTGTPEW